VTNNIYFPRRARRDDKVGHLIVQENLDLIKDMADAGTPGPIGPTGPAGPSGPAGVPGAVAVYESSTEPVGAPLGAIWITSDPPPTGTDYWH
jgi:hypothetical protein